MLPAAAQYHVQRSDSDETSVAAVRGRHGISSPRTYGVRPAAVHRLPSTPARAGLATRNEIERFVADGEYGARRENRLAVAAAGEKVVGRVSDCMARDCIRSTAAAAQGTMNGNRRPAPWPGRSS